MKAIIGAYLIVTAFDTGNILLFIIGFYAMITNLRWGD